MVSHLALGHVARDFAFKDDIAIIATDDGFRIVDYSDVDDPFLLASNETLGLSVDVAIQGSLAVFAIHLRGLAIVDISDLTAPVVISRLETATGPEAVDVDGDFAFVATDFGGLVVVDISIPDEPTIVGAIPSIRCDDIRSPGGRYAYITGRNAALYVVDLIDPVAPTIVQSIFPEYGFRRFVVDGDRVYLTAVESQDLYIIDVENPPEAEVERIIQVDSRFTDLAASDGLVVTIGEGIIEVVETRSTGSLPTGTIGETTLGERMGHVEIRDGHAFVVDSYLGLCAVDLAAIPSSNVLGRTQTYRDPQNVAIAGDYAYVACSFDGLLVFDITDPARPRLVERIDNDGFEVDIVINGHYAYVAQNQSDIGIRVFDISDPFNLQEVAALDGYISVTDLQISGRRLYAAVYHGAQIIDIDEPASPVVINQLGVSLYKFHVLDNVLYYGSYRLNAVDVSDANNPRFIGYMLLDDDHVDDIESFGDYLYVANRNGGYVVVDASDPANMQIVSSLDYPYHSARRITFDENLAYMLTFCGNYSELRVVDVLDPRNPRVIGSTCLRGLATDIELAGPNLAVTFGDGGELVILPRHCSVTPWETLTGQTHDGNGDRRARLARIAPNPFNPQTTVHFTLPTTQGARLNVYDVQGRLVRKLVNEVRSAGANQVNWDGRDHGGRGVASGTYFARLESGGQTSVKPMVLVR